MTIVYVELPLDTSARLPTIPSNLYPRLDSNATLSDARFAAKI